MGIELFNDFLHPSGCIVGSGTNLTFKGIYETSFPESPGVEFAKWMMVNVPLMLLMMYLSLAWLQFWFMGLFRPHSKDAKTIRVGTQGEIVARKLISQKIDEMGPMSFHEASVAACFVLSVLLWFFRKPQFITGWAELITEHKVRGITEKQTFHLRESTDIKIFQVNNLSNVYYKSILLDKIRMNLVNYIIILYAIFNQIMYSFKSYVLLNFLIFIMSSCNFIQLFIG